ncbi:hypothetical protein L915_13331 [Phytophthora nicotianae]|uniref:RxLR effector protein n=1 Tax=Phytophthora nicotianae TaxID=4792 RepID=W2GDL1_PHYNI|nr:hypothetical protein L915_13331 [Phytophthora nicotianae]
MRFGVFGALLVATLVSCCCSVANAGKVSAFSSKDNHDRRLQAKHIAESATRFFSGQADDKLLKYALKLSNAANGDEAAIKKANDLAGLAKAFARASDDEVAWATKFVKEVKGDEANTMRYILGLAQKEGKVPKEATAKIAETVKKDPKSWPRLKLFAKITLGATVGAFAMYGAYEALFGKKSQTGAATTTTTG